MTQKRKSRVRYDRLSLAAAILLILICTGIWIFVGKGDDTEAPVKKIPEFRPVIYLSPSNQTDNFYATGGITESRAMRMISDSVKSRLEENNITVEVAGTDFSLNEKVDFANKNKDTFTAHVAIHSNDGYELKSGSGAACYYNSENPGSQQLAQYIYNGVSAFTPTEDSGVYDASTGSTYLYELAESEVANCMIEVECHDESEGAKWIIENTDEIGKRIADGIISYVDYAKRQYDQKYNKVSEVTDGK